MRETRPIEGKMVKREINSGAANDKRSDTAKVAMLANAETNNYVVIYPQT